MVWPKKKKKLKKERERETGPEAKELSADPSFLCLSASDQIFVRSR